MPELSPETLRYGAFGFMVAALFVALTLTIAARGRFRVLLTFMAFAVLLLAASAALQFWQADHDTAIAEDRAQLAALQQQAAERAQTLTALTAENGQLKEKLAAEASGARDQFAALAGVLAAPWCVAIRELPDDAARQQSLRVLVQLRDTMREVQALVGVADPVVAQAECSPP